jgi:hypothetical protein
MWFPRTGWDQLEFESVLLSGESAKNAAKRLDTGKLPSGSEEDQKF